MRQAIWSVLLLTGMAQVGWGQTSETRLDKNAEEKRPEASATNYTVQGATPEQESVLRDQIQVMRPKVLPYRIRFVPHCQYIYAARMYQHVPTGLTSVMFTHLASRSVFIDADRYGGEDWLGHWIAHELGHLATNSASENAADKAAHEYRKRLKDARKPDVHSVYRRFGRVQSAIVVG